MTNRIEFVKISLSTDGWCRARVWCRTAPAFGSLNKHATRQQAFSATVKFAETQELIVACDDGNRCAVGRLESNSRVERGTKRPARTQVGHVLLRSLISGQS